MYKNIVFFHQPDKNNDFYGKPISPELQKALDRMQVALERDEAYRIERQKRKERLSEALQDFKGIGVKTDS